jgi:cobalt-zinc-cadmium efflux system outer membrane protein
MLAESGLRESGSPPPIRSAKRWSIVSTMVLSLALAGGVGKATARQISVEEAVAYALAYNPDLSAAARELTIARGEVIRAGYFSQFNPQLISGFDHRERSGRSGANDWRLELAQEFEIFGQQRLRRDTAGYGYRRTEQDVRDKVRLLTAAVKLSFFEAIRAREQMGLLEKLVDLDRSLDRAAQARLNSGKISQIEANLAQVRFGQTRRELLDGRERYRLERSNLGRLLGGLAGIEPEPAGDFTDVPPGLDLDKLEQAALGNRPDLRARQLEIARLKSAMVLNDRLALPNPKFGAFYAKESNTNNLGGATLGVAVPLFNRRQAEATALAGQLGQAQELMRASELNIEREVRDAFNRYNVAREGLQIYRDQVVAPARQNFSLLDIAFTSGKIDLLRLAVAVRQAFEAQMTYYDALFGTLEARVALELATGATQ